MYNYKEGGKVERVSQDDDGFSISLSGGSGFFLKKSDLQKEVEIKEGDDMSLFIKGASLIVGVELNHEVLYMKTEEDLERERKEWLEESERRKEEEFEKNKADMDAKYQNLPKPFKKRIDKFRRNNPDFRKDYEAYEVFCCEQAVLIAMVLGTGTAVRNFWKKSYDEQKKMVPELSEDHSGNTFGASCKLALWYLENPEGIEKSAGSLSNLVGSEEYGDIPKENQ